MAKFELELPNDIIKDLNKISNNTKEIFGGMTKAGAEVVLKNAKSGVPLPSMASHIKLTRTYKTPSDDGINTKVYFYGYLTFSGNRKEFRRKGGNNRTVYVTNKGVPVDFLAQVFEYGRSNGNPFPKKPFFRKSFKKNQIEKAMFEAQKRLSGGLLDE